MLKKGIFRQKNENHHLIITIEFYIFELVYNHVKNI